MIILYQLSTAVGQSPLKITPDRDIKIAKSLTIK